MSSTALEIASIPRNILQERYDIYEIRSDPVKSIPLFMKDKQGRPFKMAPIHVSWHRWIDEHKYTLIAAPRDHGKSEQIAIGRLLVELGKDPSLRAGLFSGNFTQAKKRTRAIKMHIERNEDYKRIYSNVKPDYINVWTHNAISLINDSIDKDPALIASGMESIVTGNRLDLAILDDPITKEAISSEAYRESTKETFYNDIMNLLEPDGRMIIICTLWHQDDLYHQIIRERDTNGFAYLLQAYDQDLSKLLWPEKWSKKALEARRSINIRAFDRGFRNIPISDEDALFKREDISKCVRIEDPKAIVKPDWRRYIGVDLAISKKDTADYTVLFVLAIEPNTDRKIPIEIIRRRMTSPETVKEIMRLNGKHRPQKIFVENNAYQESVLQWISALTEWEMGWGNPPIEGFLTGKQKFDEFVGLPSLASEFANNSWMICLPQGHVNPLNNGSSSCDCSMCTFIDELVNFPIAEHDDTIMAAWFAREAGRQDSRGGFEVW